MTVTEPVPADPPAPAAAPASAPPAPAADDPAEAFLARLVPRDPAVRKRAFSSLLRALVAEGQG